MSPGVTAGSLGIDIGTQSTKAVLAAADGTVLAECAVPHGLEMPAPGFAEQDAERVWWGDVVSLCRQITALADGTESGPAEIGAVTVSGLGPCVLPCDEQVRPLRPGILYGIDTRATAEIAGINESLGEAEILAQAGSVLSSQAAGPKIAWLRRHEPDIWARTQFVHSAHTFVTHKLTGRYLFDHHTASQYDPMYDMTTAGWHTTWARQLAGRAELPELVWPGAIAGQVTAAAASQTGLAPGTPVVTGTIDAWAEAYSVNVAAPGDLMLMYGSTMFLVLCASQPRFHQGVWTTQGMVPGIETYAAGMATSGLLIRWLCDITRLSFDEALAAAAAAPAGSDGVLCLPYFAGERSPVFDPSARGTFAGLTLRHGQGHLIRAGYEAVGYGIRHNLDVLAGLGVVPRRAVAVGGGTTGDLWTRIVSDVTGLTQEVPAVTTGAAYGDALLGAIAVGLVPRGTVWNKACRLIEPDPAVATLYDDGYGRYRQLADQVEPVSHALASVQQAGVQQAGIQQAGVP
ncbi:MAG TPA: FGGY family carbohydrate kinase [Streptosporangiaceae bacterium]